MKALLSAFVCVLTSLSNYRYLACSYPLSRWDLVSFSFFCVAFLSSIVVHVSDLIHSSFSFFGCLNLSCLVLSVPDWNYKWLIIVFLRVRESEFTDTVDKLSLCLYSSTFLCKIAAVSLVLFLTFLLLITLVPWPLLTPVPCLALMYWSDYYMIDLINSVSIWRSPSGFVNGSALE